jgi:hypothetical protein
VLALAPLNPLQQVVEALRIWLVRDRTRSLEISWETSEGRAHIRISGTEVDEAAAKEWLEAARKKFTQD